MATKPLSIYSGAKQTVISAPKPSTPIRFGTTPKQPTTSPFLSGKLALGNTGPTFYGVKPLGGGGGSLSPTQAIALAGAAANGDDAAQAAIDGLQGVDAHLMTVAQAVQVSAAFVEKWFGKAQADTILAMAHV